MTGEFQGVEVGGLARRTLGGQVNSSVEEVSPPPPPLLPPPAPSDLCHGVLTYATPGRAASTRYASTRRALCFFIVCWLFASTSRFSASSTNPRFSRAVRRVTAGKKCWRQKGRETEHRRPGERGGGHRGRREGVNVRWAREGCAVQFPRARDAIRSRNVFRMLSPLDDRTDDRDVRSTFTVF